MVSGFASLNRGGITRNRRSVKVILDGCWRACVSAPGELLFIADAIIANPPSFAHVHCAEALGIPVQMTFSTFADIPGPDWLRGLIVL
jgi:sterol 3beta-glucosyltransferase